MASYSPYRIPFCMNFELPNGNRSYHNDRSESSGEATTMSVFETTRAKINEASVWETLPQSCRTATTVVAAIGGALLIFGIIFNILLIATTFATKPKPLTRKNDAAAVKRRKAFKSSLMVSNFMSNYS